MKKEDKTEWAIVHTLRATIEDRNTIAVVVEKLPVYRPRYRIRIGTLLLDGWLSPGILAPVSVENGEVRYTQISNHLNALVGEAEKFIQSALRASAAELAPPFSGEESKTRREGANQTREGRRRSGKK